MNFGSEKKMNAFLRNEERLFKRDKNYDIVFCHKCEKQYMRKELNSSSGWATDNSKDYGHFRVTCPKEHILIDKESERFGPSILDRFYLIVVLGIIVLLFYLMFTYLDFTPDPIRYK